MKTSSLVVVSTLLYTAFFLAFGIGLISFMEGGLVLPPASGLVRATTVGACIGLGAAMYALLLGGHQSNYVNHFAVGAGWSSVMVYVVTSWLMSGGMSWLAGSFMCLFGLLSGAICGLVTAVLFRLRR